ncbi:SH3 domain-containing protein [Crocosphaera sp.]|uniref:SH3 domain-containing protein n=1 Tax=Crocosphaera sp. TaxID=2729996 RepID=UPI003F257D36|nr:SH3 domain-containing protein [Crocosphaera sp.]
MQQLSRILLFFPLIFLWQFHFNFAKAEPICRVTDPTGTPLNVRETPNGRIIGRLSNGVDVYIVKIDYDSQGRLWALVGRSSHNQSGVFGWVFREFIVALIVK